MSTTTQAPMQATYLTPAEEMILRSAAAAIEQHQRRKAAAENCLPSYHAKQAVDYLNAYAQNNKQPLVTA